VLAGFHRQVKSRRASIFIFDEQKRLAPLIKGPGQHTKSHRGSSLIFVLKKEESNSGSRDDDAIMLVFNFPISNTVFS
jgi:hypothetical protein